MKYFLIGLAIYIVANFVTYFIIHRAATKEDGALVISWDGWISKISNLVVLGTLSLPIYIVELIKIAKNG